MSRPSKLSKKQRKQVDNRRGGAAAEEPKGHGAKPAGKPKAKKK